MPIQSTVEQRNRTIVSRATGHITLQDLTNHLASLWVGPENAGFNEIFDWSDVDQIDVSMAELRNFAGPANAFYDDSSPSKLAIIAPGRRGARMAQQYRNFREMRGGKDPEIEVFPDMASARAWLEIE